MSYRDRLGEFELQSFMVGPLEKKLSIGREKGPVGLCQHSVHSAADFRVNNFLEAMSDLMTLYPGLRTEWEGALRRYNLQAK